MSSESYRMFLAKLENDAGLRQELRAAGFESGMAADAVIGFAAGKGYAFGIEDVGELTDRQLDAVAGGVNQTMNSMQQFDVGVGGFQQTIDSLGDLSQTESLRLQVAMERQSKFFSTLSNIMKKSSDTSSGIIANTK